jgi:transposase-like protein
MKTFKNLIDLMEFFHSEEFCHNFLKDMFWGDKRENRKCPHCGSNHITEFKDFKKNRCYDCKFEFSIRKNTIFDDSKVSLKKWFMVIYLANSNKKGVNSHAVARQIGVTQKTAWFMLQRIKNASLGAMFKSPFDGTTEIDEVYIGGSESNRHSKDKKATGEKPKTVVIGMVNRDTKQVKAMKVPTAEKDFLLPKINLNVKTGSTIVTDSYHAYKDLKKNYTHKSVKHSAGEYVRVEAKTAFKVHTNSIEGFWSLVKRTINGTNHWISKKHTNKYLAEMSFRYNTKELSDNERFINFLQMSFKKLTYKELICC